MTDFWLMIWACVGLYIFFIENIDDAPDDLMVLLIVLYQLAGAWYLWPISG